MEIITFGRGERLRIAAAELSRVEAACYDRLILLPVPTTKDKKHITATEIPLTEITCHAKPKSLIVGYEIPEQICDMLLGAGADVLDLGADEDFLVKNAEVTAHGALGHILTSMPVDISRLTVGIIGYGRIGKALLKLLVFLGVHTRVYTTRSAVADGLSKAEILCEKITDSTDFLGCDLIFNTAPAVLIDDEKLSRILPSTRIIDLASGKIFSETEGIVKLASIPEAFYPDTAGRLYAEAVEQFLFGEAELC
jgi:dipicolinate synthase subunit A